MKALAIVFAVALSGCSINLSHPKTHYATASAAIATMAIDWCTTRGAAADWGRRSEDGMPTSMVIGHTPSQQAVDLWFFGTTLAIFTGAQLLPEKYRPIVYAATAAMEGLVVANSYVNFDDLRKGCS